MEEEKNPPKKEEEFGKVIDTLHTKSKIPSLRTYQGDVAEFIKDKNKSTISIALEEKQKKEKEKSLDIKLKEPAKENKVGSKNLSANFTALILSITLIIAGVFAGIYVLEFFITPQEEVSLPKTNIIPYNRELTLANTTAESFAIEVSTLPKESGINIIKISDNQGNPIDTAPKMINFLGIAKGKSIVRSLENEFVLGTSEDGLFIIFKATDFGSTFSGMLDWEKDLEKDMHFMLQEKENVSEEQNNFVWKDAIIKNKDVRVLSNQSNRAKIYYSFLDKKTILITNNEKTLENIFSAFASKPFVR